MDIHKQSARILAALLLWVPLVGQAAVSLFESEIAVQDQSPEVRTASFKTALSSVLIRVAGDPSVLASEPAQALLANPGQLVQQYRYFTDQGSTPPALKLWVRFDGNSIRRSLQQQGVTFWGGERPDTLVWVAVEDRGKRYIVSADGNSDVHQQLKRAASQRGVPILFPLMDLEDRSQARFTDIWGGFFDAVLTASKRYKPPAVLIGRLHRSPSGGWSSRWHLDVAGQARDWSDSRQQLAVLSRQGINDMADILASSFAVAGNGPAGRTVEVTVDGIDNLAAYAHINQYLESLTAVTALRVSQVSPGSIRYALQLSGGLQSLSRTVAIGSVLEPVPGASPGSFRLRR